MFCVLVAKMNIKWICMWTTSVLYMILLFNHRHDVVLFTYFKLISKSNFVSYGISFDNFIDYQIYIVLYCKMRMFFVCFFFLFFCIPNITIAFSTYLWKGENILKPTYFLANVKNIRKKQIICYTFFSLDFFKLFSMRLLLISTNKQIKYAGIKIEFQWALINQKVFVNQIFLIFETF